MIQGQLRGYWKANQEDGGGTTYKKVDRLCWIKPEEYGHKNMENKSFGQNKMGTCQH